MDGETIGQVDVSRFGFELDEKEHLQIY